MPRRPAGLRRDFSVPEYSGGALASGVGCPRFFRRAGQAVAAQLVHDVALELGIAAARQWRQVQPGGLVNSKLQTEAMAFSTGDQQSCWLRQIGDAQT